MKINKEQKAILEHTIYRAANGLYCGDSIYMDELCINGLMIFVGRKSFVPDGYYRITPKGKRAVGELEE